MEAQLRIRQNALEAQGYMQDLLDWQQSMKAKSSRPAAAAAESQDLPAVRGKPNGTAAERQLQPQQEQAAPRKGTSSSKAASVPAAHTYKNYGKWDQFDVDAALQDEEDQPHPAAAPRSTQQQQPAVPPPCGRQAAAGSPAAQAAALKDRGNKLFQAGYYDEAIDCYNQSIAAQPTSLAYANRAMALLKQCKYGPAEDDCSAALLLDPGYVKALHRRGTARRQLGRQLEAAADFEAALRLEPGNKSVLADRDAALDAHLQQHKLQPGSSWSQIPVRARPQQQQQQEAASKQAAAAADADEAEAAAQQPSARHMAVSEQQQQQQQAAGRDSPASLALPSSRQSVQRPVTPSSPGSSEAAAAAAAGAAAAAAQLAAARLACSLKPPRTSSDFEAAWRSCRGDVQLQAKYLKLLEPAQLPAIFKNSLTAALVTSILSVALPAAAAAGPALETAAGGAPEVLDAAHAVQLVQQLVQVPRFDMTAMCLTSKDKAALKQLWDAAASAGADLQAVRCKYRL